MLEVPCIHLNTCPVMYSIDICTCTDGVCTGYHNVHVHVQMVAIIMYINFILLAIVQLSEYFDEAHLIIS